MLDLATLPVRILIAFLSALSRYLHAKDIVHGRVSSRNVFLEKKVQLSLLDYAVGCANVVYSSPQVRNTECRTKCTSKVAYIDLATYSQGSHTRPKDVEKMSFSTDWFLNMFVLKRV